MIAFCYHLFMAQALIRNLPDEVAAEYKAAAKANGRSYEAELREVIVRHRPTRITNPAEREALARRLLANQKIGSDSTPVIREAREQRFTG